MLATPARRAAIVAEGAGAVALYAHGAAGGVRRGGLAGVTHIINCSHWSFHSHHTKYTHHFF